MNKEIRQKYQQNAEKELGEGFKKNRYDLDYGFFCENCGTRIIPESRKLLPYIKKALKDGKAVLSYTVTPESYHDKWSFKRKAENVLKFKSTPEERLISMVIKINEGLSERKVIQGDLEDNWEKCKIQCNDAYVPVDGLIDIQNSIDWIEFVEVDEDNWDFVRPGVEFKCPICKKMTQSAIFSFGCDPDEDFVDFRINNNMKACEEQVDAIKHKAESSVKSNSTTCEDIDYTKYFEYLINIEKNILILKDHYEYINLLHHDASRKATGEKLKGKRIIEKSINDDIKMIQEEINKLEQQNKTMKKEHEQEKANPPYKTKNFKPESMGLIQPVEPFYIKPTLFNKKKVERENAEKQQEYNRQVEEYNKALETRRKEFYEEVDAYNAQLDIDIANDEKLIKERESKNIEQIQRLQTKSNEYKKKISSDSLVQNSVLQKKETFWKEQIDKVEEQLFELFKTRKQLLDLEIVHPKYQDIVAYTMFLDYFSTGRVSELTGHEGAYNLYESETRANMIISQLNSVLDSLEEIKANQYSTYNVLTQMQKDLKKIEKNTEKAVDCLSAIKEDVKDIKDYTQATAYNTEITAYYSKVSSELTNAMGFLIALK